MIQRWTFSGLGLPLAVVLAIGAIVTTIESPFALLVSAAFAEQIAPRRAAD